MSERTQVNTANVGVPLQVKRKDPKKVEAARRLAKFNRRKKGMLAQESKPKLNQAYSIGTVLAIGVLGLLGYYIYQRGSLRDNNAVKVIPVEVQAKKRANKFKPYLILPNE